VLVTPEVSWPIVTDGRTLVFAAALTLVTAILAGLFPALQARGGDIAGALKAGVREAAYRRSRTSTALLLVQTALSVVLLVGAGLFVRSFQHVREVRLGYDVDRLLAVQTVMRGTRLTGNEIMALADRLLDEARAIPGIASGTSITSAPFMGGETRELFVEGIDSVRKLGRFELQAGTPEYFTTLGTRILRGRGLTAEDREGTALVAVVSEAMGTVLWRGADPIGQCFRLVRPTMPCATVVGVAENIKTRGFTAEGEFHYYLPMTQYNALLGARDIELLVRVNGDPSAVIGALRDRLQLQMPGASYVTVMPLQQALDPAMRSWKSGAQMFLAFGALALVVAAIGLYGMIAFAVAQRTQEIGMRMALGAKTLDVLELVVGQGMRVSMAGVVIGAGVALLAAGGIRQLLFEVSPHDPLVYGIVAATLVIVSVLACVVPAARAARVDPNVALRGE
jgi:putative ABC transport system permease protein